MGPRLRSRRVAILVPVGALAVAAAVVSLPIYSVAPGPPREVQPLIRISGHPVYESDGRFVLTSVLIDRLTAVEALSAWIDPATSVVPQRDILAPGESEEEERRRAATQMDQSKIDAAVVVLSLLTDYPEEHGSGVLVESVAEGLPAEGNLFPGDLIVSVDGTPIEDREDLGRVIGASRPGRPLVFEVEAGGETERVRIAPTVPPGFDRPVIGVIPVENFPFDIRIDSGGVGGPSAGLMWALGLYDLLTPGDLAGGRVVAGTGQIDLEGTVHPISGIAQKIQAAEGADADVFLVPRGNLAEARAVGGDLPIVAVATFEDALDYLGGAR